jgi:hypothetical protein
METRRFDELTVALARGGSRRRVLRSLVGGVLGALALDRGGALAKNEKDKPSKDDPITIFATPRCTDPLADCPLCAEAKANEGCCNKDLLDAGVERACGTQARDGNGELLGLDCTDANAACGENPCLTATCGFPDSDDPEADPAYRRCQYAKVDKGCRNKGVCCNDYQSEKFGTCVAKRNAC